MKVNKTLLFGLFVVVAGWAILFTEAQLNLLIASIYNGDPSQVSSLNLGIIAQCAILSGFGIAILGTLQTGFSILNQFFDAVSARNGKSTLKMPLDLSKERSLLSLKRRSEETIKQIQSETKRSRVGFVRFIGRKDAALLQPNRKNIEQLKSKPRKIVERGWVKDRAYVLFADGAVEVETMLGLRRFTSLQDAQEFIS